eukprot:GHUV01003200.1.p1 GENE.GHUV01003200.1~~GHUV01003200.1.p1  ORF type:complete len:621 (+),score=248.51 GHUV01003200.1:699-2561(+)
MGPADADAAGTQEEAGPDPMIAPVVNGYKWFAKALLVCGLNAQQVHSVVAGPAHAGGHHLSSQLRFVTLRNAARPADLSPLGGPWDPEIDAGDPQSDDASALKQAVIRHVKRQVGLDISGLGEDAWTRFADIIYSRPGTKDLDATSAATAALEAGALRQMQAQDAAAAGESNGMVTNGSTLLEALAELPAHDPAGQEYTEVTAVYLVDIGSLMPPPAPIPAKVEVKQEQQQETEEKQEGGDAEMTDAAAADVVDQAAAEVKDVKTEDGEPKAGADVTMTDADKPAAADDKPSEAKESKETQGKNEGESTEGDAKEAAGGDKEKPKDKEGTKDKDKDSKDKDSKDKEKRRPETPKSPPSPPPPSIALSACRQKGTLLEPHALTLSVLLDYDEGDDQESLMELALIAEGFHEMLMKAYGDAITAALLKDRPAVWRREVEEEALRIKRKGERRQKEEDDRKRREERRKLEEARRKEEEEELKRKREAEGDGDKGKDAKKQKTEESSKKADESAKPGDAKDSAAKPADAKAAASEGDKDGKKEDKREDNKEDKRDDKKDDKKKEDGKGTADDRKSDAGGEKDTKDKNGKDSKDTKDRDKERDARERAQKKVEKIVNEKLLAAFR